MKTIKLFLFSLLSSITLLPAQQWIRVNQIGYQNQAVKNAVLVSTEVINSIPSFEVRNALTDQRVFMSQNVRRYGRYGAFASTYKLDFSNLTLSGSYYVDINGLHSPVFRISPDIYNGTADFLLQYVRQQRSGYNPYLNDSCHTQDGFIIYHPTLDSIHIDVSGGWHDASDYLQYVTTTATATYQMLFAYQLHPHVFKDEYRADGNIGANGIPDILDEATWGLTWLLKMNPQPEMYFNQIADDRDHRGFRLPTEDTVYYGKGTERPVYYINGKPQGIYQYQNRTSGAASSVAKFASSFALGAMLLKEFNPEISARLQEKSVDAYEFALRYPGVSQTAPCRAPYFYEEDNWVDDMELAAAQLYAVTGITRYAADAVRFGSLEPTTPWLGADTARHYQWYPFVNLGHYLNARNSPEDSKEFIGYLREGIEKVYRRGKVNAFSFGIPFIWCSNNLVSSFLSQLYLYRSLTLDSSYIEMESSLRDWLFGCNPWGTSMIVGLPSYGDAPDDPHSAFTHVYGYPINGGLVDGPVRASIFNQHSKYIRLTKSDPYAEFQSDLAVYHDDWGDYTNNEPTMDGTAGLTIYLSSLQENIPSRPSVPSQTQSVKYAGAIVRFDTTQKTIFLVFTGDEFSDGGNSIVKTLQKHSIQASFFFTGNFYRNSKNKTLIERLIQEGHYLGAHSDKHLLYAPWNDRDSLLVSKEIFSEDLKNNYKEMAKFGLSADKSRYFLPPYEWYNETIADWTQQFGLTLINFTAGTSSNADYTTPDMPNYVSSDSIIARTLRYEAESQYGLNGFLLLSHIGTNELRIDKFYDKLDPLITELQRRGYSFKKVQQ